MIHVHNIPWRIEVHPEDDGKLMWLALSDALGQVVYGYSPQEMAREILDMHAILGEIRAAIDE